MTNGPKGTRFLFKGRQRSSASSRSGVKVCWGCRACRATRTQTPLITSPSVLVRLSTGVSWDQVLWPDFILSHLPPGNEDASVGLGHSPQVSSTNTAVVMPWLFGASSGDGRSSWVVVLCLQFFPRPQILWRQTLETWGSTPADGTVWS